MTFRIQARGRCAAASWKRRYPMRLSTTFTIACCLAVLAPSVHAQRKAADKILVHDRRPAGMCRVWVDGVPAAQQPAPTECAAAVRHVPANGRVIYGSDFVDSSAKKAAGANRKTPVKDVVSLATPRDLKRDVKGEARKVDKKVQLSGNAAVKAAQTSSRK